MPRSSRHKSSKHSSRDARDYSDSEKDSSLKSSSIRVSKDSSGDKRKLDSKDAKDAYGTGNGEYSEEYGSSKRRKERAVDDGVSDRWNGGEEDRGEGSRKSKISSESKSKRKEESEGKHRESSRKDRESGGERERKGKEGKSDRVVANEEERPPAKQLNEITEPNAVDIEPENHLEKRIRKKRDGSGDGDKHLDNVGDTTDSRRLSSKDDISKDGKQKDEKHKDDRYRDKYREDLNWENKHRDEKLRDERPAKDHTSSRSDDKHLRDDKDMAENRQKKSKLLDHDREQETDRDRDRDLDPARDRDRVRDRYHDHERESERERERERDRNRNRDRDRDHDRDRDYDRDWDRDQDWDRERERDKERSRGRDRDRERNRDRDQEVDRDRERDYDHDGSYHDDRSARYKDSRGRKRSPDDRDDYNDSKARAIRGHQSDMEKKPLSSSRAESEADRGRSQSRQVHADSASNRRKISPNPNSHVSTDEHRNLKSEESKYRDSVTEQRSKAVSSREVTGFSGVPERSSKYRSTDKPNKMEDGHLGELSAERSSGSKASPMGLVERSPSSNSVERRYMNRSGVRRNLDVEETGRRNGASIDARDTFATEDRSSRDLPLEKPLGDDSSQADSSFYGRNSQNNSSSIPPLPGFRAGVDSPSYMGSLEDDSRFNSSGRYKRSGDHNSARGHGNAWRGVPNWSSPMPNGFMPFQHGPPHGGFQAMMPQFPSPPLFGVRPMEMNHAGIPYHIPDADRFSGHLRPLGWQNMMDGSGPSHLHGWDGNNGVFRDEPHMYGAPDWDQNRHPMNRRSWETSAEMWKGQNGDVNKDLPSSSQKEDYSGHAMDDEFSTGQTGLKSQHEHNHVGVHAKEAETRSAITSPIKNSQSQPKVVKKEMSGPSKKSSYNDVAQLSRAYLSKLDISRDLAYPELYSKCMKLLDPEGEGTIVEDVTVSVNLEGGERPRLKISLALQNPLLFPDTKDVVFKRAMDLYKKQHIESRGVPVSEKLLDLTTVMNLEKGDDQIPNHKEGKTDEQVLTSNEEMTDALVSTSDQQKSEAAPSPMEAIKEEPVELVPASDLEVQEHILTTSPVKLEAPIEAENHENPEEPLPKSSFDKKDEIASEVANSDAAADKDCFSAPNSDSIANGAKTKGDPSEESLMSLGDGMTDSLCYSDGSSKALKPESNESESVVLSQIHHSPESTH